MAGRKRPRRRAHAHAVEHRGECWIQHDEALASVPPSYKTHNVESESKDPNSILNVYKKVLALRHTNEALLEGSYTALNGDDPNVMSYLRSYKGKAVLVALNMSATAQKAVFNLSQQGFKEAKLKTLISSEASSRGNEVSLKPFGLLIAEVD